MNGSENGELIGAAGIQNHSTMVPPPPYNNNTTTSTTTCATNTAFFPGDAGKSPSIVELSWQSSLHSNWFNPSSRTKIDVR